jgi:hypothetical protein
MRNAVNLLSFESTDWGNAPTRWQRSLYPPEMRPRISVLHEGIDTDAIKPDANAWLQIERGNLRLTAAGRGRHLCRPQPGALSRLSHLHARDPRDPEACGPTRISLIVGGDEVSYGCPLPGGPDLSRRRCSAEMGNSIDTSARSISSVSCPTKPT